MYCTSLRQRTEWAPAIRDLSKIDGSSWKETTLETHDLAFPIPCQRARQSAPTTLKLLLLSASTLQSPETLERVSRLRFLDGGINVCIVLLLDGSAPMTAFTKLEMEMLKDTNIPIIPIPSPLDLSATISSLKKQYLEVQSRQTGQAARSKDLVSSSLAGRPLSNRQTNMLIDMYPSLKDLSVNILNPEKQQALGDLIGNQDCQNIISFLSRGPQRGYG